MNNLKGVIVKGIGGFYYVNTDQGIIECRAKGVFRKMGITPLVGDVVEVELNEDKQTGVVAAIKDRRNTLVRPAVANISQMMAVVALESPKPNLYVLDKLIASAEFAKLKISLCFNKSDLTADNDLPEMYKKAGFEVVVTSALDDKNIDELKRLLKDEVTVFAGNSGVGKSSLLNRIVDKELFETGGVSKRTERGRHTTRHSELVELPSGGYIIDTPGFSSFELAEVTTDILPGLFREFDSYLGDCRFLDCRHISEPDCKIREALKDGQISESRHESYKLLFEEIKMATAYK
ncbi:MAG: ribosome small subunit-dependent GTPase A [Clostridia bacterium]|nr:ribosome small subunit-dependent GTPase A [Clostridia bacterium]